MRRPLLFALVPFVVGGAVSCSSDKGSTEPGTGVSITWASCINDVDAPAWFAIQNGSGAWNKVTQTNGVYTFLATSDKIGVATFANGTLIIRFETVDELKASVPNCNSARRAVSGTVTGYVNLDDINIFADQGQATVAGSSAPPASFTLTDVTPSAFDVIGIRSRRTVTGSTFQTTPTAVFIRRAQNTTPLASIDLNSATESGAPTQQTASISNTVSGEDLFVVASLNTTTTAADMGSYEVTLGTVSGAVTAPFFGLASTRLSTGDAQTLDVIATQSLAASSDSRSVTVTYTDAADKSATLGPALGPVTVTGSSRPGATYTIQTGYDQLFELDLRQGSGITAHDIIVVMTRGYAGSTATQVNLSVPNLSGVSGFNAGWLFIPGTSASWTFRAANATLDVFQHNNQNYSEATRTATFTP